MLLNANFSINQREETSYTGSNVYSVDRWKLGNNYAKATVNNNIWSFAINNVSTASSRTIISQTLESFRDLIGQNITASIKYSNLTEDVANTTYLSIYDGVTSSTVALNSSETFASVTHTVDNNATEVTVIISTSALGINASITPVWCKLEIGSYATRYQPRQVSDELWLCQRYYQKVMIDGQTGNYVTPLNFQPIFVLANSMRANPTITVTKWPLIYGLDDLSDTYVAFDTIQFTFKKIYNNLLTILIKTGNNSTTLNFKRYNFYSLKNGEISLDAEIY